jgi:putative transcriptional regulator
MSKRSKEIAIKIVQSLSELTVALENGAPIGEKFTCRRVMLDLVPIPYNPATVKATRRLLHVSQAVFAMFLGVKVSTVQGWEQGKQPPGDMASRFMDEIQRNPEYWRGRLRDSIRIKEAKSCPAV